LGAAAPPHCFAQLEAASFVPGARTHLTGDMAVDLYALEAELGELAATTGIAAADHRARVTIIRAGPRHPGTRR